jgi:SAM-dependent methyltransferase
VLDVGCGILERPTYLKDFKKELIFGIDPFDTKFDGNSLKCSSEHLPFQAGFFNLVIASSTIDHFLDWQESFLEIDRVLENHGKLAIYQHLSNTLVKHKATNIDGRWFRIFESGFLIELESEFADPFHSEESQNFDWNFQISDFLIARGYVLKSEALSEGFTFWIKVQK